MVQTFQDEVMELKNMKDWLQLSVAEATRNGREIHAHVTKWLTTVENYIEEADELIRAKEEAKKNRLFGFSPNLRSRRQLIKKADKKLWAIIRFYYGKIICEAISFQPQIVKPSICNGELFPSRLFALNQIMDALKDPSLNMIGMYGVRGVGKTTLAKEVLSRAREDKLFDDMIMISVSRFPNLRRIQREIAGFLGLKFDAEEVLRRAKLLIILDDVWERLDLHAVGIPFGDDCQGCKLLITSRRKDVVSSEIGSQKDFLVDVLRGEESWSLFQTVFAPEFGDSRWNATAIEIAKKCAGLPLLIMLVSLQLKNKELYALVDMLKQLSLLKNEALHKRVHRVVESSFENLPGEEFKLFLLCASLGQSNIQVQHLLIYGMGLSLFGNVATIEEARDELFFLIDKLKEEGLLLDGDLDGHVKLHDVVRDAAIPVLSGCQNSLICANESMLRDWLNKDPSASLRCPEAELLLLSAEDLCLEIPDLFFKGIAELKVVDFTGIHFAPRLPSSLGCLRNLDTLCLHRCGLDNISVIGELKELKSLSLADSEIVECPREIEALTKLKLLDLTNCSKLRVIPSNVISKLFSLEELYMCNCFVRWDKEGNVSLAELEQLCSLSSLEIQIVNSKLIRKFSSFYNELSRYKIIIGEEQGQWENHETSRILKLIKLEASIHLEDAMKVLLTRIEDLYIDEVSGMQRILNALIGEGFPKLRHLCIKNDYGIQHLINSSAGSSSSVFPVLESLRLDNLNSLKMICDGPLKMLSFATLRILIISNCGRLKSLVSYSNSKSLRQLQELEVESCENIETIVIKGSEDIEFTRLISLKLKNLPNLKGFCIKKRRAENIGLLFHDKITFFDLTSLEVKNCKSLKYLFTKSNVKLVRQLKRLEIHDCDLLEEIIWHKESEGAEEEGIVFPNLKYVSLQNLKNLKRIASKISAKNTCSEGNEQLFGENVVRYNLDGKSFPRLTNLHIQISHGLNLNDLNSLESFYVDDIKSLNVSNCNKIKILLF